MSTATERAPSAAAPYEDLDGLVFPEPTKHWLDVWKRPAGVAVGDKPPQVVELESLKINGAMVMGGASGRVFRGALYAGNPQFEWLMGIFLFVQQMQGQIAKGNYLYELIHPQVRCTSTLPMAVPCLACGVLRMLCKRRPAQHAGVRVRKGRSW